MTGLRKVGVAPALLILLLGLGATAAYTLLVPAGGALPHRAE